MQTTPTVTCRNFTALVSRCSDSDNLHTVISRGYALGNGGRTPNHSLTSVDELFLTKLIVSVVYRQLFNFNHGVK